MVKVQKNYVLDDELQEVLDGGHGRERPRRDHRTMLRRAWDEKHLRSVGCKLSVPVAARFKRMCDDASLTRYEVLRRCVMDLLQRHGY